MKCVRKYRDEFPKELAKDISKIESNYQDVKEKRKAKKISEGQND